MASIATRIAELVHAARLRGTDALGTVIAVVTPPRLTPIRVQTTAAHPLTTRHPVK